LKSKNTQSTVSFIGKYEITVLDDQRLILPSDVIRQLNYHGVRKVLPGRLPGFNALVLCPETLWEKWLKKLKRNFPSLKTHSGARSFLIPWRPTTWDSKGRISLPRRARSHLGLNAHDTAILIGTGFYLELWTEEEYDTITQECELAIRQMAQPRLPLKKGVSINSPSPRSSPDSLRQRHNRPS